MRTMVFDVPAEFGGALTILKQYHEKAMQDVENEWIFVVSKPELEESKNVKVLRFPWVKKSWFMRLFFDKVFAKTLIKKYSPDKILSLQNTTINTKKCFQELYVHQSIPFSDKRFFIRENFKFWMYQNVIGKMIIKSVRKADSVIVQTKWMKEAVVQSSKVDESKVKIQPPKMNINTDVRYEKTEQINFFYPANSSVYKNHKLIYEAVKLLRKKGYKDFKVYLTIQKPDIDCSEFEENIEFCGYMNKEQVNEHYKKSALLFPSYIETFGLPLLEARTYGCPVIASNCAFSREVLDGYEKAEFFDPFSSEALSAAVIKYIETF